MKWFIADLHFGHEKIITKMSRKAESLEWWNKTAIDALNLFVGRFDHLYILGDFSWGRPDYWRQQINCKHIQLIRGNHDKSITKLRDVFGSENIHYYKVVKIHGVNTVLFHYPIAFWDGSHKGTYHLYGHIHHSQPRERLLDMLGHRRSMDVSPEASLKHFGYYRPFNEDDVHAILGQRSGHDFPIMENQ